MKKIRVLIVEDSPTVRLVLEQIVGSDPRLEVAASVGSAETLLTVLETVAPDVISLDIRLPGMNGLDATQEVMRRRPTPIVVVAADVSAEDGRLAMNALRAGALAVMEKPVGFGHAAYAGVAQRLCDQLILMSKVKVVRQVMRRPLALTSDQPPPAPKAGPVPPEGYSVLGIVASTGGPAALVQLLGGLGPNFPLPILLVQHIGGGFLDGFADWLENQSPFAVRIARQGESALPGTVYLAPPDRHLLLRGLRLELSNDPPVAGQRPSGTVLLRSIAGSAGVRGIGVVLTGMGNDGADGLLDLARAGGHTVAEDMSTAVVYGMPAAAAELGAVKALLPLTTIAPHLLSRVSARAGAR